MKKIIMSGMILVIMSILLSGCIIVDREGGGHERGREGEERHEHHEERRY